MDSKSKVIEVSEGKVKIYVCKDVFYNKEMELCRDISSILVGAIDQKISVADVMCATGIRGIRYKIENKNVSSLFLSDVKMQAVNCAKKNASKNKVQCIIKKGDARKILLEEQFDFLELDPFGSPQPFLYPAAVCLSKIKKGFLSITATDTAVLCGAHYSACIKNYGAYPLNNEFCHENAARILAGRVIFEFAPFNLEAKSIFTFSHRHYIKMFFSISSSAKEACESVKSLGFGLYCHNCMFRKITQTTKNELVFCPICGEKLAITSPIFTKTLWDETVVKKMAKKEIEFLKNKEKIKKILSTILEENNINSYGYYDLHFIAKKYHLGIVSIEKMIELLKDQGFICSRTHFSPTSIRTDASIEDIIGLLRK